MSAAVKLKTISHQDAAQVDVAQFDQLHAFLRDAFPKLHEKLTLQIVDGESLLYTWQGSQPDLKPYVLMAHQDVVPVEPGTEKDRQQEPFAGRIANGTFGDAARSTTNPACSASWKRLSICWPRDISPGTVILAFGHDEETLGHGAMSIAELLKSKGITPEYVVDEGLVITNGMMPGVSAPVALVGMAQKGYLTLQLTAKGAGGHSSMPPEHTAVGLIATAVHKLEQHPVPGGLSGIAKHMFQYAGPEMDLGLRLVFGNTWLLGPMSRAFCWVSRPPPPWCTPPPPRRCWKVPKRKTCCR